MKVDWPKYVTILASFLTLATLWGLASLNVGPEILPDPFSVLFAAVSIIEGTAVSGVGGMGIEKTILYNVYITLLRLSTGLAIAMIIGTVLGLAASRGRLERIFDFPILIGTSVTTLIIIYLGIAWMGTQDQVRAATFAVAASVTPYVAVNVRAGAKAIDRDLVQMGRVYGANRMWLNWDIYIPSLLPFIFSASRYSFAASWKMVILAERLGLSGGIGFAITYNYMFMNVQMMLAWIIIFLAVAFMIEIALNLIEKRIMIWKPKMTT